MKAKALLVTIFILVSLVLPFTSVLDGHLDQGIVSIEEPDGLTVKENGTDVMLNWSDMTGYDGYNVYQTSNINDEFPDEWERYNTSDSNWTHEDALSNNTDHFYLVRGVKDGIQGNITSIGYKVDIELKYNSDLDETWNWISLPYDERDHNEDGHYTALDIVEDIDEDAGVEVVNKIAKWNASTSQRSPIMRYNETLGAWNTSDDFSLAMGDAVALNVTSNQTWTLTGVERSSNITENLISTDQKHFLSIPYTIMDLNRDGSVTASDIVADIEGGLGLGRNETIHSVNLWNDSIQGEDSEYFYTSNEGWSGENFVIDRGDGIYLRLNSNLSWTPSCREQYIRSKIDENRHLKVEFISPTSKDIWTGGKRNNISWEIDTNMHISDISVKLEYVYNGTGPYLIDNISKGEMANYTWNHSWRVPDIDSDDVSLIITAEGLGHRAWNVESFKIDSKPPSIVSYYPEKGNETTTTSYLEIEFDESVRTEDVENNFTLYDGNTVVSGSMSAKDGKKTMRFTPDEELTRQVSYTYELKGGVRDISDPGNKLEAELSVNFTTVEGPPEVTVTGLSSDTEYRVGNTTHINWTVGDGHLENEPIDISYSLNGGTNWTYIVEDIENNGSYLWEIPKKPAVEYPVSNVIVNVSCTNKDGFTGSGHSVTFTIFENKLPDVEVLRPYEGMQVVKGQDYIIKWEAKDEMDLPSRPIVISISTDGGVSWKVITQQESNDGAYRWKVKEEPGDAIINVTCIDSNQESDWNHSQNFTILEENPLNLSMDPDNESYYTRQTINLTWDSPPLIEGEQHAMINFTGDGENWRTLAELDEDQNYSNIRFPFETSSECKLKLTIYDSEGVLYKIDSKEFEVFPKIVGHEISYLGDYFMIQIEFEGYVSRGRMERALTIYKDGEPMDISLENTYQKTSNTLIYISPTLPKGEYRVEFNSSGISNREFEDRTVFTFEEEGTESKIVTYWPMLFLIPLALIMFYLYRGKGEKSTRKMSSDMVEIER